jgi:Concanavalin A-like lectin/glucanases superfamily
MRCALLAGCLGWLAACGASTTSPSPSRSLDAFLVPNSDSGSYYDLAASDAHVDAAQAMDAAVPRTGLVGEWLFSDNLNDTSGNNNNGVATGATFGPDRFGVANSATVYNGVNQYVSIPSSPLFTGVGDLSISAWINPTAITQLAGIASKCQSGDCATFTFRFGFGPWIDIDSITTSSVVPTQITVGTWQHVAATLSAAGLGTVYVNGVEAFSHQQGFTPKGQSTTLRFGVDYQASFFDGSIDDVRIYSRVLAPAEVMALANDK